MKEILFKKEESAVLKSALILKLENEKHNLQIERLIKKIERAERQIKVSSAKGKGRNLQYWVCERIARLFNIEFVQSDDNCPVHSREMGQHGTDIALRGWLQKAFPFDVECKATESINLAEWIRQARANNKNPGRKWLVVFKKQSIGAEPVVCMDWLTFERLCEFCKDTLQNL